MKKLLFAVLLIAAAVFCSGGIGNHYAAETRTHSVRIGETLWDVASSYMNQQDKYDDVRALMYDIEQANGMDMKTRHSLKPGQVLIIPLETKK